MKYVVAVLLLMGALNAATYSTATHIVASAVASVVLVGYLSYNMRKAVRLYRIERNRS